MPLPSVFDPKLWKVTFPVPSKDDSSEPQEYAGTALAGLKADEWARLTPWCHPTADGTGIEFAAPVNGKTTKRSKYPRCELREMNGKGGPAKWSGKSGYHRLTVREAFTRLPNDKPHIVGAQIHGGGDDVTVFRLEGSSLWITKGDDKYKLITDKYVLGTPFEARWDVYGGNAHAFYNGREVASVPCGDSCYFKAGAYVQANTTNSKPPSASNYGATAVYSVKVEHSDKPLPAPGSTAPTPTPGKVPPTVLMVRHAEKPPAGKLGMRDDGTLDPHSLSPRGWRRAGAIIGLFTNSVRFPRPTVLYGSQGSTKSRRPVETITELAESLGVRVTALWDAEQDDQLDQLVADIRRQTGTVLVSLEREAIPAMARAFGTSTPDVPEDRYDIVWILKPDSAGKYTVTQMPQLLLPGDRAALIN